MDLYFKLKIVTTDHNEPAAIDADDVASAIRAELSRALSPEIAAAVTVENVDDEGNFLDVAAQVVNPPGSLANIDHSYDLTEPPGDDADVLPPA